MMRKTIQVARGAVIALVASIGPAAASHAATLALLQDGSTLARYDTDLNTVTGSVPLAGGARLVAMDVRPADGRLYGLTAEGAIVVVDPMTGTWTKVSQLSEPLPAGEAVTADFNPVADRLRVITAGGLNLRVNVEDGKAVIDGRLRFAEGFATGGQTPRVVAAAYTNSRSGARDTALFDIESRHGLMRQAPPNDGILNPVGSLGVALDGAAFDISTGDAGEHVGWLVARGEVHRVDLASGRTTRMAGTTALTGRTIDLAVLR